MLRIAVVLMSFFVTVACSQQDSKFTAQAGTTSPTPIPARTPIYLECPAVKAAYKIAGNDLWSENVRHVWLYLEPAAFNEKNLKKLFACVSKANPEPVHLTAELHTDWSRLPEVTSTEPGGGCGECKEDPHRYDFLQGWYMRREKHEWIEYSPAPHIRDTAFKTIVIRGKLRK
jgi:hypothetical protein